MDSTLVGFFIPFAWIVFAGASALTVFFGVVFYRQWSSSRMNRGVVLALLVVYSALAGLLLIGLLGTAATTTPY